MVLERLFPTKKLIDNFPMLFIYSFIVIGLSLFTAYFFFKKSASIIAISFITIAFTHIMHRIYMYTEKETEIVENFWKRYGFIFEAYVKIFIALAIIFALVYVFLPQNIKNVIFADQINVLKHVETLRSTLTGNFYITITTHSKTFFLILFNNLEVLLAILLLSFLYGAGAIFLIAYQASIIGTIIGANILTLMGKYNYLGAYGQLLAFLHGSYISLAILPHGIFELLAYFFGAMAGGIISALIVGHYSGTKKMLWLTIKDIFLIIILSILFLVIGAYIETILIHF